MGCFTELIGGQFGGSFGFQCIYFINIIITSINYIQYIQFHPRTDNTKIELNL